MVELILGKIQSLLFDVVYFFLSLGTEKKKVQNYTFDATKNQKIIYFIL